MVRFKGRGRGGGRGSGLGAVGEDTIGRGDDSRSAFTGDEGHLSKQQQRQNENEISENIMDVDDRAITNSDQVPLAEVRSCHGQVWRVEG